MSTVQTSRPPLIRRWTLLSMNFLSSGGCAFDIFDCLTGLWNTIHIIIGVVPSSSKSKKYREVSQEVSTRKNAKSICPAVWPLVMSTRFAGKEKAQQWLIHKRFQQGTFLEHDGVESYCRYLLRVVEKQITEDDWWKESKTFNMTYS